MNYTILYFLRKNLSLKQIKVQNEKHHIKQLKALKLNYFKIPL